MDITIIDTNNINIDLEFNIFKFSPHLIILFAKPSLLIQKKRHILCL